jgi:hypothetical protein
MDILGFVASIDVASLDVHPAWPAINRLRVLAHTPGIDEEQKGSIDFYIVNAIYQILVGCEVDP